MSKIVTLCFVLLAAIVSAPLASCHYVGHFPPGQVKNVIDPPPGHGGIPPGQLKKY